MGLAAQATKKLAALADKLPLPGIPSRHRHQSHPGPSSQTAFLSFFAADSALCKQSTTKATQP
jgi:hypothetical protein